MGFMLLDVFLARGTFEFQNHVTCQRNMSIDEIRFHVFQISTDYGANFTLSIADQTTMALKLIQRLYIGRK